MKTIYKKLLLLFLLLPFSVLAQSTLNGTVLDNASKQPLPGVNVVVQGSATGTQTDFDGKFQLGNLKKGDVVVFSYLGYKNATITFASQSNVNISLEEDSNQLQEVVIQVGYGSVKKKDATGSVELITTKEFTKGAITSVEGLLNGRASGVVVTASGTPGDNAVIRIRGGNSLSASNDPLIVVDGLPLDGNGGLSSINPNDIESMSILKDASAAAIYGNRASGGVILITTKKGSKKDIEVNINSFTTYNTLAKKVDVYSADEFRNIIAQNAPDKVGLLGDANTDWQKEIFRPTYTSEVNASVLGNAFGFMPMRVTIGNTDNNGILMTSEFRRTTGSFSLNPSLLDDHLKLNVTGNYSYTFKRKADEGAIGNAISYDPTQSVYDPTSIYNGYREWIDPSNGNPRGVGNPVGLLNDKRDVSNAKRFFGNFNLDYKFHFLPELRAIVNAGIDVQSGNGQVRINPLSRSGYSANLVQGGDQTLGQKGSLSNTWYENQNKNLDASLNYNKKFGKFNVDVLGGYNYQQFDTKNYKEGNRLLYGLNQGQEVIEDVETSPGNNLQAYFGRLNLGFDDKYLLTVNFRRDGSSKISPVNKWANFMGYAFAWKIKEESFLKDSKVFSDLKLRLSYGETGQQNIGGAYEWFERYSISNNNYYQFGDDFYLIGTPRGYNKLLKWERTAKYNVGLDFGFFNNRLRGNIDAYSTKTDDLFSSVVQGALQNLSILGTRNIGSLETKGLEVGLNLQAIDKENFTLDLNYNFSYNKMEITDLFTNGTTEGSVGLGGFVQTHREGLSPFSYWVYEQVYDANGRPMQGVYVDRNGDGVINSSDKYNYKKPQADYTMGLLVNATFYKNWDFSMAWRSNIGNYVYDKVSADRSYLSGINNLVDVTINNAPVDYNNTTFTDAVKESDYYVKDASFIKLDNITLGYTFNNVIDSKASLKFTAGVQNVLVITKYKGLDPEVFNNGMDGTIFPRARMFMLGVNAKF